MNMYKFSQLITQTVSSAKQKSLSKNFLIPPETLQKVTNISEVFTYCTSNMEKSTSFDTAFNSLDITVKCYVFEASGQLLNTLSANTDILCIDAEEDGRLCFQMKLLNAATII